MPGPQLRSCQVVTAELRTWHSFGPTFSTFYTRPVDVDRWLEALDAVLGDEVEVVIGGHGHVFTEQWIAAQRWYLAEVQRAVGEAKAAGASPEELEQRIPFDDRFAEIADMLDASAEDLAASHLEIVVEFWGAGQAEAPRKQ